MVGLLFGTRGSDSTWVAFVGTCRRDEVSEGQGQRYAAITGPESHTGTTPVPEGGGRCVPTGRIDQISKGVGAVM